MSALDRVVAQRAESNQFLRSTTGSRRLRAASSAFREALQDSLSAAPTSTAQPSAKQTVPQDISRADWGAGALTAFQKACADRGMNTAGCEFQFNDEIVQSPAGGFRNPNIQVTLPGGRVLKFSADLTLRSPWLAAFELQRMMSERTEC